MKKLIVSGRQGGRITRKGLTVSPDEINTMEDLVNKIRALFSDESVTGLKTDLEQVEVTDINFVQDGDRLSVITPDQELKSDWITLNVGGHLFSTCKSTILMKSPESVLARMFANEPVIPACRRDKDGYYLIDRTPKYFEPILNYLRTNVLTIDSGISIEGKISTFSLKLTTTKVSVSISRSLRGSKVLWSARNHS